MERRDDIPILMYVNSRSCPACANFAGEWRKIKKQLAGKARFVNLTVTRPDDPKPLFAAEPFLPYVGWWPSILLVGPRSYYRIYTSDDKMVPGFSRTQKINAKKYGAYWNEDRKIYQPTSKPYLADDIVRWVEVEIPEIMEKNLRDYE